MTIKCVLFFFHTIWSFKNILSSKTKEFIKHSFEFYLNKGPWLLPAVAAVSLRHSDDRTVYPTILTGIDIKILQEHWLKCWFFRELERKIGNGPGGLKTSSKNGKSSADSEGSPDEGISLNNRKKPGTLNDNFTRQR